MSSGDDSVNRNQTASGDDSFNRSQAVSGDSYELHLSESIDVHRPRCDRAAAVVGRKRVQSWARKLNMS